MKQARHLTDRELADALEQIAMIASDGPIRALAARGRVSAITRQVATRMRSLTSPTSKTGRAIAYLEAKEKK